MKNRRRVRKTPSAGPTIESNRGDRGPTHPALREVQMELPADALADRLPEQATPHDRERAEVELRRLTAIVRNVTDAVIIQTFDGGILAWNRGAELMYGYAEEEAVGMNIRDIIPPRVHQKAAALSDRIASGEAVGSFETRRLTKDGRTINVWVTATTLTDASGRPEAIATTERDITQLKEAEETIRVQQSEIAHFGRVHAMGEFAAALAHELNQPLCAIGVNARAAQRMIDAEEPLDELQDALGDILQDVERAGRVVQGIRDQLQKCEPEFSTLNINAVVGGIAPIAEALGRNDNTGIRFILGDGLGPVQGDRIQLQQVLLNLIRNGVEAMPDTEPDLRILIVETTKSNGDEVQVCVRDHGQGLRDSVAERMFEPFFSTKQDGMGMGLAICSSIIQAHGGRLWATQNADAGCTVQFSLPCYPEANVP